MTIQVIIIAIVAVVPIILIGLAASRRKSITSSLPPHSRQMMTAGRWAMSETQRNEATIMYFHQPMRVSCDRQCGKAWGINSRPSVPLSADEDDYAFLADSELGDAPIDPGTYEGGHGKPTSPHHFPNKWCVRECERCIKSRPSEAGKQRDFSKRFYNMPSLHPESEASHD